VRPDFDVIFEEMKELAISTGETNIAVVGCGPEKMLYALKKGCRRHSCQPLGCGKIVFFVIHRETFNFLSLHAEPPPIKAKPARLPRANNANVL